MTEISMKSAKREIDPRPLYFVKMYKDGTFECSEVIDRGEPEQNSMELEYLPPDPTTEEKIKYALSLPKIRDLKVSDDLKLQVAQAEIEHPDFSIPKTFDPNVIRVHDDPDYFFKTPAKPVIWTWKRVEFLKADGTLATEAEMKAQAVAEAEAFRQDRLKVMKNGKTKWDMTVEVYKQRYNVVEA
jgi:hypothetical protein